MKFDFTKKQPGRIFPCPSPGRVSRYLKHHRKRQFSGVLFVYVMKQADSANYLTKLPAKITALILRDWG
jgi:hypothetical protein